MNWHEYLEDQDVHVIDCSGKVDFETGSKRLSTLALVLETQPPRAGVRRLLIDFRETEWDSEATHQALSIATRERFDRMRETARLRVAILNRRWEGCHSDDEHWFFEKHTALSWLSEADEATA